MSTNKLALTSATLNSVARTKDVIELPAVMDNWVRTYEKVTGRTDGVMRYEAEKVLFMQTIGDNKALDKCERFSLYSAWTELAISGLTLRDGLTYIIPYGKKASFMVGWKGRLEQINEIPSVVFTHEPVVVYDTDDFDYERGLKTKINKHKPGKRTPESFITHVYFVIEFNWGPEVYLMERDDVLNIRDNYSTSYKQYVKDLPKLNPNGKITKTGPTGTWEAELEKPMWVSDEAQAFKKTLVRRVYGSLPKLPKHKYIDEQMAIASKLAVDNSSDPLSPGGLDPDEMAAMANNPGSETTEANTQEHDFAEFTEVNGDNVNTNTGEIKNDAPSAPNQVDIDAQKKKDAAAAKKLKKQQADAAAAEQANGPANMPPVQEAEYVEENDMNTVLQQDNDDMNQSSIEEAQIESETPNGAVQVDDEDLEGDSF